jgi:signal transduction histidine kinase
MAVKIGGMTEESARLQALCATGLLNSAPDAALERYIRIAQQALEVPVVLISLVEENRQFFANSSGLPSPWAERRETPLSHSFCKHVVESKAPLIVNDAPNDSLVHENLAIRDLGFLAYAGFPITTEDSHTLGSFAAIHGTPHFWTDRELAVLKDIAEAVSAEVDLRRRMRRAENAERALLQLNENLLEGKARSVESEKTFRHDLRSPLQVVSLGITTLLRSGDFVNAPQLARSLTLIERNVAHAVSIINLMKEPQAPVESAIDVSDVVDDAVQAYQRVDSPLAVCKTQTDDVYVRINPTNLRRCIENLLANSVRFARSRINISVQRDGAGAMLTVEDDGPGLPTEQAYADVWVSGMTFHRDQGRSGTGLGLHIVRDIVERAGGTVSAGHSALGGARFALWFPLSVMV